MEADFPAPGIPSYASARGAGVLQAEIILSADAEIKFTSFLSF